MGVRGSLTCVHELVKSHGLSVSCHTPAGSCGVRGHLSVGPGCRAPGLHQVSCFLLLGTAPSHGPEVSGRAPAAPSGTSPVFHSGKKGLNFLVIPS